jgi:hypothetical protein
VFAFVIARRRSAVFVIFAELLDLSDFCTRKLENDEKSRDRSNSTFWEK